MDQELNCKIIEDLLPGYIEHLTNDVTNHAVEYHLETCPVCRDRLECMKQEIPVKTPDVSRLKSFLKKVKRKHILIGASITAAVFLIAGGVYFILSNAVFPVAADHISIYKASQLQNGNICFWLGSKVDSNANGTETLYEETEDGGMRVVIEERVSLNQSVSEDHADISNAEFFTFSLENAEGKSLDQIVYRGSSDGDIKIIWEKGTDLPKADEETERYYENLHQTDEP